MVINIILIKLAAFPYVVVVFQDTHLLYVCTCGVFPTKYKTKTFTAIVNVYIPLRQPYLHIIHSSCYTLTVIIFSVPFFAKNYNFSLTMVGNKWHTPRGFLVCLHTAAE
jgi:hypothetical protein